MVLRLAIKIPISIVLLGLGMFQSSLASAGIYSPERRTEIFPNTIDGLVALDRESTQLTGAGCTGFFIAEDLVMTAKHCPSVTNFKINQNQLSVFRNAGRLEKDAIPQDWDGITRSIERGKNTDYQILRVLWFPGRRPTTNAILPLKFSPALSGEPIKIIGYPIDLGGRLAESTGELLSESYTGSASYGETVLVYNASQTKQNSGGPLFESKTGRVIGVVSTSSSEIGIDPKNQNIEVHSMAVPISQILKSSKVLKNLPGNTRAQGLAFTSQYELTLSSGKLNFDIDVYLIDSEQFRVEFLGYSFDAHIMDKNCGECEGRIKLLGLDKGVFVLRSSPTGLKSIEVVEEPSVFGILGILFQGKEGFERIYLRP